MTSVHRGGPATPVHGQVPRPARVAEVDDVVRRVEAALPDGVVHVAGSRRMGCAAAGADLDLVAVVPREVDLGRVVVAGAERVRPVVGARVPGMRFLLDGLAVDLTVVADGQPGADIALSAVTDAEAVLAAAGYDPDLARAVKAWAAARGLDSAPHGGLPGIAWAVLAARTVRDGGGLADFFGQWAAWDWREPVTLSGDHLPATGNPMTIMTPGAPVRSCTEQVTAGMRDLITTELYAAWEGAPATPPHRRHAAWAVVTAEPVPGEEFDFTLGRLRGRIRALLGFLPSDAHAWPAAFERTGTVARYAIGLGADPPAAAELDAAAGQWRVPGVRVKWAANGDVPTLGHRLFQFHQ